MTKMIFRCKYDVVVVGGGMSGVCAAIASARHGASTALIQNRPVLGGNASSEIRMHICGAGSLEGRRPDSRETGILEEICLESRKRNPNYSFSIFDTILWEKARFQDNLELYLNTHLTDVYMDNDSIKSIKAEQMTTEKIFEIEGGIFIDATGDGTLGFLAGAEFMAGREGKKIFGEKFAPDESDHYTMGNSLMFKAVDTGEPVSFEKPSWANTYTEDDLKFRDHKEITSGYWWIELGGGDQNTIGDSEEIRDELMKAVYGVWDHIKNGGEHGAENYDLDWVQFLPGKRENRRLVGDYILKEQDLLEGRVFEDAVAYGGWPMDMHITEGLRNTKIYPTHFIHLDEVYTIPYRSIYSRNISNLMLAGRAISVSHMAFGSTRDMGTTSVVGQAAGTAAAIAIQRQIMPKGVLKHIKELQQKLLKDDCFIPGIKNEDDKDIAKLASVSCSSQINSGECNNIINGYSRKIKDSSNCWISGEISDNGEWIALEFANVIKPKEISIFFDSNLSKILTITLSKMYMEIQGKNIPQELVKDYDIEFLLDGNCVYSQSIKNNYLRFKTHKINKEVECNSIRINALSTHGDRNARIFEVRVY